MSQDLNLSASSHALDEETARAEVYGLLSQLLYAAPSVDLLDQLQVAVTEAPDAGGFLEEPWRNLVASARSLNHDQVVAEYNRLFGGVGQVGGHGSSAQCRQLRSHLHALVLSPLA